MTTFWMTWKPTRWPIERLEALLGRFAADGSAVEPWRIAGHRTARIGDRIFCFKQGTDAQRGIFGAGELIGLPYLDKEESPDPDRPQYFAPIKFDQLVDPRRSFLLPYEEGSASFPTNLVNSQASGNIVREPLATELATIIGTPLPLRTAHSNPDWSRDELILALELYIAKPESPPGPSAASVIELSQTLNQLHAILGTSASATLRNANGVAMKLQNFRRLEPRSDGRQPSGLSRGNRLEEEVWLNFRAVPDRLKAIAAAIREGIEEESSGALGASANPILAGIEEAPEGRLLTVTHLRRERSPELARSKKERVQRLAGRLACEACKFDFAVAYGERGHNFIECHHTKPLETLLDGARTRLEDLALLCANCHRMIHTKRPWLTMDGLRLVLSIAKS